MARNTCNVCGGRYSVLKTVHLDSETMRLKACLSCNKHYRTYEISEKRFELLRELERGKITSFTPAPVQVTSEVTAEQDQLDSMMRRLLPNGGNT